MPGRTQKGPRYAAFGVGKNVPRNGRTREKKEKDTKLENKKDTKSANGKEKDTKDEKEKDKSDESTYA